jgi:hypothetical protein
MKILKNIKLNKEIQQKNKELESTVENLKYEKTLLLIDIEQNNITINNQRDTISRLREDIEASRKESVKNIDGEIALNLVKTIKTLFSEKKGIGLQAQNLDNQRQNLLAQLSGMQNYGLYGGLFR